MQMRRPLIWLLLWMALFNAVLGAPLHEAWHIAQQGVEAARGADAQDQGQAQAPSEDSAPDAESQAHCAWCLTHAFEAATLPVRTAWRAPATSAGQPPPALALSFVPGPGRWRFASRDPPSVIG